jgi:RimJ/RimL family protein N-acetyltransferase
MPHLIGLPGKKVRLVPPDRALHLENALAWLNDPEVNANLQYNLGMTRRDEEAFFDRIERRAGDDYTWAIHDPADRHIGFIGLHNIHPIHRSATGGLLIGDRAAWNQGFATDAVNTRSRFAFRALGLHRIDGHTTNPAMERVYLKTGYIREGTARQKVFREGAFHDVALYGLLAADWREKNPPAGST